MSKAKSGYESRIVWAPQGTIGVAATPSVLWLSSESDSLVFGDVPIDFREAFTGARGAYTTQYRVGNYAPEGDLGPSPIYLDGSSTDFLNLCNCFFQTYTRGTENEASAIYTYTFSPSTSQIDHGDIKAITILKDTGLGSGACPRFMDCVMSKMTLSYTALGGVIEITPSFIALSAIEDGTAPGAIDPSRAGYLMAPNIAVTYNGTAIHPVGFTLTLDNSLLGVPGPSHDAYRTFSFGQTFGQVELKTWRDDSFFAQFIAPYETEAIGTLIITATVDTGYGTHADGSAYTAVITAYTRVSERQELSMQRGEMTDTTMLEVIYDASPSVFVNSVRTSNL